MTRSRNAVGSISPLRARSIMRVAMISRPFSSPAKTWRAIQASSKAWDIASIAAGPKAALIVKSLEGWIEEDLTFFVEGHRASDLCEQVIFSRRPVAIFPGPRATPGLPIHTAGAFQRYPNPPARLRSLRLNGWSD